MSNTLDVFMSVASFGEDDMRGKTAIIIDVLRASSTMVTAIRNGARGIIPVENMEMAGKISKNLDSPYHLLCGEKDGKKIEGYDLGNSPLEYTREVVEDKKIIFNTTNGTKAVKKVANADEVIIGSFLNLDSVIRYLITGNKDVALVCAGWRARISLEDLLCAGNIIYELNNGQEPSRASDGVRVAFGLYEKFGDDIEAAIKTSSHAMRLQGIIDERDIHYCCKKSAMDVLPILNEGIITDLHGKET